jgi:hypothetical protein
MVMAAWGIDLPCVDIRYSHQLIDGWNVCTDIKQKSLENPVSKALRQDLQKINSFLPPQASAYLKRKIKIFIETN